MDDLLGDMDWSKVAVITMTMPKDYPMSFFGLRQIWQSLPEGGQFHILINGTEPGFAQVFKFGDNCHVHEVPENLGVAGGRNHLIQRALEAGADYIFSLDDDFVIPRNFFQDLLSVRLRMEASGTKVGIIAPMIVNFKPLNSLRQLAAKEGLDFPAIDIQVPMEADSATINSILRRLFYRHSDAVLQTFYHFGIRNWRNHYFGSGNGEFARGVATAGVTRMRMGSQTDLRKSPDVVIDGLNAEALEVECLPGGGCLYSRELIETIGMTDLIFTPFGYEDADFSIRAIKAGFHNFTTSRACLIHDVLERAVSRPKIVTLATRGRFQGVAMKYLEPLECLFAVYTSVTAEGRKLLSRASLKAARGNSGEVFGQALRVWLDYFLVFLRHGFHQENSFTGLFNDISAAAKAFIEEAENFEAGEVQQDVDELSLKNVVLRSQAIDSGMAKAESVSLRSSGEGRGFRFEVKKLRLHHSVRYLPLYPIFSDEFFANNKLGRVAAIDFDFSLNAEGEGMVMSFGLALGGSKVNFKARIVDNETELEVSDTGVEITVSTWARAAFEWWCRSYQVDKKINFFEYVASFVAAVFRKEKTDPFVDSLARAILLCGRVDVNNGEPIRGSGSGWAKDSVRVANSLICGSVWQSDADAFLASLEDPQEDLDPEEAVRKKVNTIRNAYYGRFGDGLPDAPLLERQAQLEQTIQTGTPANEKLAWTNLKDKYRGERCFIIGNGPSLNKLDMSLLRPEWSIGVNSIFLHPEFKHGTPKHYVVEDVYVAEDRASEISQIHDRPCWFGQYLRGIIPDADNVNWINVSLDYRNRPEFPKFCGDIREEAYVGGSVTYICMQIAYFLGFSKVYLIGFDHSYQVKEDVKVDGNKLVSTSDDPNHFDPSYFGKGYRWHVPNVERMERGYLRARQAFEADNRRIYNATPGGKLEVFERVDFNSLF